MCIATTTAKVHALDHPSTVGGLAFDAKGQRLAVAHYGGVTVWAKEKRGWKSAALKWAGSHTGVTFSPDGRFLLSSMQENALHGWRLRLQLHPEDVARHLDGSATQVTQGGAASP